MAGDTPSDASRRPPSGSSELETVPTRGGRSPAAPGPNSRPRPPSSSPRTPPAAPTRPALHGKQAPPVIVKLPPPASIRLSVIGWVLSIMTGSVAIIYLFAIRIPQLPEITEVIAAVDTERPEETQELAASIIFWVMFGLLIAVVLAQILFLVSFTNRRPRARWWQFGSLVVLTTVFLLGREVVAVGERGVPLEQILLLQLGLATLGLLFGFLPGAVRWSARQYDVVDRPSGAFTGGEV